MKYGSVIRSGLPEEVQVHLDAFAVPLGVEIVEATTQTTQWRCTTRHAAQWLHVHGYSHVAGTRGIWRLKNR